jgi:hypothetical protein
MPARKQPALFTSQIRDLRKRAADYEKRGDYTTAAKLRERADNMKAISDGPRTDVTHLFTR